MLSNTLQTAENASNSSVIKAKEVRQPNLLRKLGIRGLRVIDGQYCADFRYKGIRHRDKSGYFESKKELKKALAWLIDFQEKLESGKLIFDNQKTEIKKEIESDEILYVDFLEAGWNKKLYDYCTFEEARFLFNYDRDENKNLKKEIGEEAYSIHLENYRKLRSELEQKIGEDKLDQILTYKDRLKPILAFFGQIKIGQIDSDTIDSYRIARKNLNVTDASINRELVEFNSFWKRALKSAKYKNRAKDLVSPFDREDHFKPEAPVTYPYWREEEQESFFKIAHSIKDCFFPIELFTDMMKFLFNTGLRIDSCLSIEIEKIDLNNGGLFGMIEFDYVDVKGKRHNRTAYMQKEIASEIVRKYIGGRKSGKLFTWEDFRKTKVSRQIANEVRYPSFSRVFNIVFMKAGFDRKKYGTIHSATRKTYGANRLIYDDISYRDLMLELWHDSEKATRRYINETFVKNQRMRLGKAKTD